MTYVGDILKITSEYSNAVLVAIMPYVSDFADKVPIESRVSLTDVRTFICDNSVDKGPGGVITTKNGDRFIFSHGLVEQYESIDDPYRFQTGEQFKRSYPPAKMTSGEATAFVRRILVDKLDLNLEDLFVDLEPEVSSIPKKPFIEIKWLGPQGDAMVAAHVDVAEGRLLALHMPTPQLWRIPPKIDVSVPMTNRFGAVKLDWEASAQVRAQMIKDARNIGERLGLVCSNTTPESIRAFSSYKFAGINAEMELTNGYKFVYRHGYTLEFFGPDCLLHGVGRIERKQCAQVGEFVEDEQLIVLAREFVWKLGLDGSLWRIDQPPSIHRPHILKRTLPRATVIWPRGIAGECSVEIDTLRRSVTYMVFYSPKLAR